MKVSSKIILGFLTLISLTIVVLVNQFYVIYQLQSVNRDLSGIDMSSVTILLSMQELASTLNNDLTKKYFGLGLDPSYAEQITTLRNDLLEHLDRLRNTVRAEGERAETRKVSEATEKIASALNDYWRVFNRFKDENQT